MTPAMSFALLTVLAANPYVTQAKVFQQDQQWEKCLQRLEVARERWKNAPEDDVEIELYTGLCRLGLGHEQDAREHFAAALKLDPEAKLPLSAGSRVIAFFERVRTHPEEAVVLQPEVPRVEAPVESTAPPSATAQVTQRHLVAPIVLGSAAVVSTVIASVFGAQAKSLESQANAAVFESDIHSLGDSARGDATAANVFFAVAAAALIAALVVYFVTN